MPSPDFKAFIDAVKASAMELFNDQIDVRDEFLGFVEANGPQLQAFLQAGDQAQVGVMAFRFRTWARDHNIAAIRAAEQKVWSIAFTALKMALAVAV